ncbi:aliphatic sulfonates ABC transporter substrate-binding protein [Leptolyngbya boryana NIES-2135]|uniref:Putative aliphatic sulfonates-binding protein n=1 Tax=Leptolyngbya boryana NIES-2135 TaxID=1973484 RepID=A0A1Z4J9C4_LEPBY|nr:sulfonate ABC transporter substrate-binding protein [Leptolyngbya boryana]ULP30242.1 sulfonate ABC transporter substrate-binding protein [Leptolyngbya boryana IU 594]BAS54669.1 aliphatic sulfonates ABC transporter substrate-binding protein [Leptolyngbya boryana IAM M-101]BAS61017.1 aliphatic sulfonates ABC transporter substrate-binding protein [Leptolyngbya boryana dg5]BAY53268.1 aliphatic sulfonates ABC transporter substrate-binding protein [Leptolyngbya boryana NIES-2135]
MFTQFNVRSFFQTLPKRFRQQAKKSFTFLFTIGLGLSLVAACSSNPSTTSAPSGNTASPVANVGAIRIGYQKAATILSLLKSRGELEKALAGAGGSVTWTEFPAGPPMLEAMNAGAIDFGYTGESPPIIAQAAGTPVRYVAYDPWSPKAEAIVVRKDSPIQKIQDLKGKKVAFAKGSNTNYLVISALQSAGLSYSDITPAFLTPADARAAFEGGNVDAWAIWDPYLAVAEESAGARIIQDATGLAPNRGYYLAAQSFIEKQPQALKTLLEQVKKVSDFAKSNPAEVAKFLSPELGIDAAILEKAEKRREYGVLPLTNEVITKQQAIADAFHDIKLIPKKIAVKEAVSNGL